MKPPRGAAAHRGREPSTGARREGGRRPGLEHHAGKPAFFPVVRRLGAEAGGGCMGRSVSGCGSAAGTRRASGMV